MPADVRVLASTSAALRDRVVQGRFREELWSQFGGSALAIPTLRERRDDIPILIDYFAAVHCAAVGKPEVIFAPDALRALMEFSWPGNVRELRSVTERLVGNARSLVIVADELPVGIRPRRTGALRRGRERRRAVGEELFVRLITNGESFWSCVYPLFMEREITRTDVRDLVRRGLEVARGNSETLVRLFNMPAADHKRFVGFPPQVPTANYRSNRRADRAPCAPFKSALPANGRQKSTQAAYCFKSATLARSWSSSIVTTG